VLENLRLQRNPGDRHQANRAESRNADDQSPSKTDRALGLGSNDKRFRIDLGERGGRRGLKRDEVERGQVLSAKGAIKARTSGKAQVFVLTAEEGGRHTPFASGYRPQFFFGVTNVTGVIHTADGSLVEPGAQVEVSFELARPVGIEPGVRFAIREGGKTVGAGVVTEVAG
jgi:translation elongation factor EF-Tu-like GTPase